MTAATLTTISRHQPGECPNPGACSPSDWPGGVPAWMLAHKGPPAATLAAGASYGSSHDEQFADAYIVELAADRVLRGWVTYSPDLGWRATDGTPRSNEAVIDAWRRYAKAEHGEALALQGKNLDDEHAALIEELWRHTLSKGRLSAVVDLARGVDGVLDPTATPTPLPVDVATLRERRDRPRAGTDYRVTGWLPTGGRILLAAQFKAGKTTMVGNLARCLVDGDPWLGQHPVTPITGTVVLIDTEMTAAQLDHWLTDQSIVADDRVVPIPLRGNLNALDLLTTTGRAGWATRLRELRCGFLILDCLRPVLDAFGLDEHRDTGRFLVAFDALLAEAGIGEAMVVHHMGHNGERARGDSRLQDWPDVGWRLVREDQDPASARYLAAFGRDVDQRETRLEYDSVTRRLTAGEGSRAGNRVSTTLAAVLAALHGKPRQSLRELQTTVTASGHARDAVREAIVVGRRTGQITTEPGPRNSILHSAGHGPLCDCAECAGLRGGTLAHSTNNPVCECAEPCGRTDRTEACECAAALIEPHTRTLADAAPGVEA